MRSDDRSVLMAALDAADEGRWNDAHAAVQALGGALAAWAHANLHREEGDLGNAQYWYRRAGLPPARDEPRAERQSIREALTDS